MCGISKRSWSESIGLYQEDHIFSSSTKDSSTMESEFWAYFMFCTMQENA